MLTILEYYVIVSCMICACWYDGGGDWDMRCMYEEWKKWRIKKKKSVV